MHKNIAVLAGDGIGPEIITEAIKVLQAVAKKLSPLFHIRTCPDGCCCNR